MFLAFDDIDSLVVNIQGIRNCSRFVDVKLVRCYANIVMILTKPSFQDKDKSVIRAQFRYCFYLVVCAY